MRKIIYLLLAIIGLTLLATPANYPAIDKKIWIRIDSLEAEGLYRSALGLVDRVYNQAREESDAGMEIKALIYKLKYTQELEEEGQLAAIAMLEKELPDNRLVQGALKHSMLAELYERYFMVNRWQISQNPMEDPGSRQPLRKWSPERFFRVILDQYELSLQNEDQLNRVRVGSIPELWTGNLADTVNKPGLYDVLISRALNFLQNAGDFSLSSLKPAIFCSPELFAEPSRFIKLIPVKDTTGYNPYCRALNWYGSWLEKSGNLSLLPADLNRLSYLHQYSSSELRDSLYESSLVRWSDKLAGDSSAAMVYEALALYHLDRGNLFRINDPDTLEYGPERKIAANWLEKSKKWAVTLAGKRCLNLLSTLMKPELSVLAEGYQIPQSAFPVSVEYRNLADLHYRIYKMNGLSYYSEWNDLEPAAKLGRINGYKAFMTGNVVLPDDGKMNPHRASLVINPLPAGFYLLAFSNTGNMLSAENLVVTIPVCVSGTNMLTSPGSAGGRDFYFRDRTNGSPLKGLVVIPWYLLYDQESRRSVMEKGTVRSSGSEGFLELPDGGPGRDDPSPKAYRLQIINKQDTLITRELFYPEYRRGKAVTRTGLLLFTDRSLYKPGEETFFRGVMIDYTGDSMAVHRADSIELILQDPRYQVVDRLVLPVDTLGVFSGAFKLPFKGLTGNYIVHSQFGQASVRMEQYRRPGFSVRILRGNDIFMPGDTMRITGLVTALSGEPVPGAEVFADVDLLPVYGPRRWSPNAGQKIRITTIKATTDQKGGFTCSWLAVPVGQNPLGNGSRDRYSLTVRVTDLNGESHQDEAIMDCGRESASLALRVPGRISSTDTLSGKISGVSTDGRVVRIPAKLRISKLKDPERNWIEPALPGPDRFLLSRQEWVKILPKLPYKDENQPETWAVASISSETGYPNDTLTGIRIPPAGKWQIGWYKVDLIPADPLNCKTTTQYFYAEDTESGVIDKNEILFAKVSQTEVRPGQILELVFASNPKGILLVELQKFGGHSLSRWYVSEKKKTRLSWKVENDWQGGAMLNLIMLNSNRVYEKEFQVSVPWVNSDLTISGFEKIKTVKPGDSVSINLRVKDENGEPVRASVGITVYDASLDQVAPHNWPQVRKLLFSGGNSFASLNSGLTNSFGLAEPPVKWIEVSNIEPVDLNWFGLGYYGIARMDAPVLKMAMAEPNAARGPEGAERIRDAGEPEKVKEVKEVKEVKDAEESKDGGGVVIRSDFRETALFTGNMITDQQGIAVIRFKVPEVFTEWKVLATGHDRKLSFGHLEHNFKSAKDLMIKSNFPEFMRRGDTVDLAARLGWYGKDRVETVTSLTLSDTSGKMIRRYADVKSELSPGGVVPFTWQFTAEQSAPVGYVIRSSSSGPADGLKDTIRVYPDEVQLWNAQPFFFSKPGRKELKIETNPVEAIFEVTTSPAWQILQSLPVVTRQERDCSEYWFSRLYLACLAGSIADKYPDVAARFLSDPVQETQKDRMQQIRVWMNMETRGRELAYVLEKLSDLQNQDGTWPWFKGMGTDLFMTQQIIAGFGELNASGIFNVTNTQRGTYLIAHAIEAMDNWLYRQFREVIRQDSVHPLTVQLNPMIIHYINARSFFPGVAFLPANEIAWIHFTQRIPVEWTEHGPGLQALMGIACLRLRQPENAAPIYRSLRERAKIDEQWGMFWPRKGYGSSWFEWDLWMQSRMIELFAGIEDGRKDLDQLKLYLIHQKRGRDWGNGMVAAWAAKSMLFFGNDSILKPASVSMTWGREKYSALRINTGGTGSTGYYRYEWKNPDVMPGSRSMQIEKSEGGPAWGTLFTLNNHKLDKLSVTGGPLIITREVMIRGESGRWEMMQKGQQVHVGDVARIRLTIKSDRELSYIEVRDFLGTGFMPVRVLSGYQYNAGLSYYRSREPESIVYFISQLPKGDNTIEYQVIVEQAGNYSGGYATATSLYAPEFRGWSDSFRMHAGR